MYSVRSKSNPGKQYEVDMMLRKCTCPDFPQVNFCKHISAVQDLFEDEDEFDDREIEDLSIPLELSACTEVNNDEDEISAFSTVPGASLEVQTVHPQAVSSNLALVRLGKVAASIGELYARVSMPGGEALLDERNIKQLECLADELLRQTSAGGRFESALPPALKLPPNKLTRTETAEAYGLPSVKTRKRKHLDPYAGGEQSGKLAKPDAKKKKSEREPKKSENLKTQEPVHHQVASTSTSIVPPPTSLPRAYASSAPFYPDAVTQSLSYYPQAPSITVPAHYSQYPSNYYASGAQYGSYDTLYNSNMY